MKLLNAETAYCVYITRSKFAYAEIAVEVTFDGSNWVQTPNSYGKFNQFFLNCMGNAITEAITKKKANCWA